MFDINVLCYNYSLMNKKLVQVGLCVAAKKCWNSTDCKYVLKEVS